MHQFSRDASVAEAWLLGQEPYLSSREIGQSVDEVEKLIKRHEAFEKSAATWDERFAALERLTTVSALDKNNSWPFPLCCQLIVPSGFPVPPTSSPFVDAVEAQPRPITQGLKLYVPNNAKTLLGSFELNSLQRELKW